MALNRFIANLFKRSESNNIPATFSPELLEFISYTESCLGILNKELLVKLRKDYKAHKNVYELKHNQKEAILFAKVFHYIHSCNCKTLFNIPKWRDSIQTQTIIEYITKWSRDNQDYYPALPVESIDEVVKLFDNAKHYYTSFKLENDLIIKSIIIEFYSQWDSIINLNNEDSGIFWLTLIDKLVEVESDPQAKTTIRNVIRRKMPYYDEYLLSRGL